MDISINVDAELLAAVLAPVAVIVSAIISSRRLKRLDTKVAEVHVLVNSKMTEALERIVVLKEQLEVAHDATKKEP